MCEMWDRKIYKNGSIAYLLMWVAIATPDWKDHGQDETKEIEGKDNH